MNTRKIAGVVLVLAGISIGLAGPAEATKGPDHKQSICHPVEGDGELGNGWNLIPPDKASSHIDENGNGFHTRQDGRTDVYAIDGTCPGLSVPTDTTTTTTSSSTTTTTIPPTTTTTTSTATTTTATSTPSSTTSVTKPPAWTPSAIVVKPRPTTVKPVVKPYKPKPTTTQGVTKKPVTKTPIESIQTVSNPPAELAYTGFNYVQFIAAMALILTGIVSILTARKIEVVRNAREGA